MELNDKKLIQLNNRFLSVSFSQTGSLDNVQHIKHNEKITVNSNVIRYGSSTQTDHNSGAYLFLPDGEAKDIPMGDHDLVRIQRGPLVSRVDILHEIYGLQYKLTNTNGSFLYKYIENKTVSILGSDDYTVEVAATTHLNLKEDIELALRFTTGIKNEADFFTDLNGFQVYISSFREWTEDVA
jgi:alpha-mannosidase II